MLKIFFFIFWYFLVNFLEIVLSHVVYYYFKKDLTEYRYRTQEHDNNGNFCSNLLKSKFIPMLLYLNCETSYFFKIEFNIFFSQYIKAYDDVGDDAGHTDDGGKYW